MSKLTILHTVSILSFIFTTVCKLLQNHKSVDIKTVHLTATRHTFCLPLFCSTKSGGPTNPITSKKSPTFRFN